jgi:hypothetical protein
LWKVNASITGSKARKEMEMAGMEIATGELVETTERGGLDVHVDALVMRCATCRHWGGDKAKAIKMYRDNPISMDLQNGWPDYAPCRNSPSFTDVTIHGDTWYENKFAAGFGCILWEA